MRINRIAKYLADYPAPEATTISRNDWLKEMREGGIHIQGTVKLVVSEKGKYSLNIILSPVN